jgi:hypothetical protein
MNKTIIKQLADGTVRLEYVDAGEWRVREFELQDRRGHVCERDHASGYVYAFICRGLLRGNNPPVRVSSHDTLLNVIRDEWARFKQWERACTKKKRG